MKLTRNDEEREEKEWENMKRQIWLDKRKLREKYENESVLHGCSKHKSTRFLFGIFDLFGKLKHK